MHLCKAKPGDVIRILTHHPQEVTVEDLATSRPPHSLLMWRAGEEHGTSALGDYTTVELVARSAETTADVAGELAPSPVRERP